MTNYESKVVVNQPKTKIFEQMEDLRNLEKYKTEFPNNDNFNIKFQKDFITAENPQFGQITVRITEKDEQKKLKFAVENIPVAANFCINFDEIQPEKTQINLILEADIPFFIRPMLDGKLRAGLDKAAELLSIAFNK